MQIYTLITFYFTGLIVRAMPADLSVNAHFKLPRMIERIHAQRTQLLSYAAILLKWRLMACSVDPGARQHQYIENLAAMLATIKKQ